MNRQQAINYLLSSGFSEEQINTIEQAFKQEPTNDLVVDCISRQAVIDLMMQKWGENFSGDDAMQECIDAIRDMPSVTPQEPKTGHWNDIPKYKNIAWQCSECGRFTTMKHNYCPNCGAKMVEPESED